jgi:hypothetical protein
MALERTGKKLALFTSRSAFAFGVLRMGVVLGGRRQAMSEEEIPPYASRLCAAREQAGKSVGEMAALVDLTYESYCDLERFDDEVFTCISIKQFALLCHALDMSPRAFFSEEQGEGTGLSRWEELARAIRTHLEAQQITLSEFEDRVGWDVSALLEKPDELATDRYNIDSLRDICCELGVNWVSTLSAIVRQHPATAA